MAVPFGDHSCISTKGKLANQPAPTLPAVLATAQPPALVTALAEENLKNRGRDCDSSRRELAELDLRQSRAGKVPLANILVLNRERALVSSFLGRCSISFKQSQSSQ